MLVNYHRGIANIAQGLDQCLYMGTLDALRDWGLAKDYVEMQWLMLQQDKPEDFVIATGVQFSVRTFIDKTAKELGITLAWDGDGIKEQGRVIKIEGDCCGVPVLLFRNGCRLVSKKFCLLVDTLNAAN